MSDDINSWNLIGLNVLIYPLIKYYFRLFKRFSLYRCANNSKNVDHRDYDVTVYRFLVK